MALVDSGAECAVTHGNPQKFSGPLSAIDGYGGQMVVVGEVLLTLQNGRSPSRGYEVFISPIPESIWGTEILQGQTLHTSVGAFCLLVRVSTPVLKGNTNW